MDAKATTHDDVGAIKKVGEEFFAGTNSGDLDRRMATMAPDAIIMPPNRPSIVGKGEIRQLSQAYQATFEEKCILAYDEIETAGNWGFVRATVTATRTAKSDGAAEKVSLKNLWILKRQPDGKWKFWRIMFNSNNPPAET
jgi:ketosteroid isomerase-like protein